MTDDKRLKDTLAKLAEPVDAAMHGSRNLRANQSVDMLQAILGEIDDTVLARKLTLQNESGDIIELEAANRRLLCLASLSGDIAATPHLNIVGEVLSDARTDLVEKLHAALDEFASGNKQLSVTASASMGEFGPAEPGMSAMALGAAWADSAVPSTAQSEIIGKFADACQDFTTAEIRLLAGEVELKRGESDKIELLIAIATADRSGIHESLGKCLPGKISDAHLIARSGSAEKSTIVSVSDDQRSVYMLMPSENRFDSFAIWQDLAATD